MSARSGQTFVVVGAGLAAGKAVQKLRDSGFDGRIVLFGDEKHFVRNPRWSRRYLARSAGESFARAASFARYDAVGEIP